MQISIIFTNSSNFLLCQRKNHRKNRQILKKDIQIPGRGSKISGKKKMKFFLEQVGCFFGYLYYHQITNKVKLNQMDVMKKKVIIGSLFIAALGIYSCQKSENNAGSDLSSNLEIASAEVMSTQLAEVSSADVQSVSVEKFDVSGQAFCLDQGRLNWRMDGLGPVHFGIPHIDSCATVTVSGTTFPKVITIDYGTGCTSHHGHVKSGKIIINLSDTITNEGAIQTIQYENFAVDSTEIELTATLKNLGKNVSGNWVIEKSYEQTISTNGETSKQTVTESIEWVSGFETSDKSDDVFYKSGSGSITLNDTLTYNRIITKPLLIDRSCGFIKSGTIELVKNGVTVVVDYGDGTCDNVATVTTDGVTEEIDLTHSKYNSDSLFGQHCKGYGHKGGKGKGH